MEERNHKRILARRGTAGSYFSTAHMVVVMVMVVLVFMVVLVVVVMVMVMVKV